jgi:hypothetical protein
MEVDGCGTCRFRKRQEISWVDERLLACIGLEVYQWVDERLLACIGLEVCQWVDERLLACIGLEVCQWVDERLLACIVRDKGVPGRRRLSLMATSDKSTDSAW